MISCVKKSIKTWVSKHKTMRFKIIDYNKIRFSCVSLTNRHDCFNVFNYFSMASWDSPGALLYLIIDLLMARFIFLLFKSESLFKYTVSHSWHIPDDLNEVIHTFHTSSSLTFICKFSLSFTFTGGRLSLSSGQSNKL